jgi:hypothetical protein
MRFLLYKISRSISNEKIAQKDGLELALWSIISCSPWLLLAHSWVLNLLRVMSSRHLVHLLKRCSNWPAVSPGRLLESSFNNSANGWLECSPMLDCPFGIRASFVPLPASGMKFSKQPESHSRRTHDCAQSLLNALYFPRCH